MTSTMWKDWSRPRRTGYTGAFGDTFFSDCWDVVDRDRSRSTKIIREDVTSDVPDERVKPMFRKSHLNRMSSSGDDVYQVMLDVKNFTPIDLSVKLVDDKTVIVEGKHGERKDPEGFVSREFTRKYNLPESVQPSSVECYLSSDGVLVIRGQAGKPSSHKSPFESMEMDTTIPIVTDGYQSEMKTQDHEERIIKINLEERSGKSSESSAGDERDRMSPRFADQDQSPRHQTQNLFANEFIKATGRSEKERTVSFDESYEESHHGVEKGGTGSGRNSRMSDDVFDKRSPYIRDGHPHHGINFEDVFTPSPIIGQLRDRHASVGKESRGESMESQKNFSRNVFQDMERSIPFPMDKDLFANISIPKWKDLHLNSTIPVVSKEEHYDKHFEKGYKNGNWIESFEERFRSEQYSASSSKNRWDRDNTQNTDKSLENQSLNHQKERLIKISSPA